MAASDGRPQNPGAARFATAILLPDALASSASSGRAKSRQKVVSCAEGMTGGQHAERAGYVCPQQPLPASTAGTVWTSNLKSRARDRAVT